MYRILLTMVCELHLRGELLGKNDSESPKTMTDLYNKLADELFKKFVINKKRKAEDVCTPKMIQALCGPVRKVIEKLSLKGLCERKIIFQEHDLDEVIAQVIDSQVYNC